MIETTALYKAAITGQARRIRLRAAVDLTDPDAVYGTVTGPAQTPYSRPEQLHDKILSLGSPYASLEPCRWLLSGAFQLPPPPSEAQTGVESSGTSDDDGSVNVEITMPFTGVGVLQALSVYFPNNAYDGYAQNFIVAVKVGTATQFSRSFIGNTERAVHLKGFTVNNPTAIVLTVRKWSLPFRRIRIPEIVAGIYEIWDGGMLAEFGVRMQGNFTDLTLPYGTCDLSMDNLDRRFEPRNKDGVFKSIEERQGIEVSVGVDTEAGTEYIPGGVYYLSSGGWTTGDNGITMKWSLVDIIGLLTDRRFEPPATLPTTLSDWAGAITAQLGVNFAERNIVDAAYAALPVTASAEDLQDVTCGQVLLWICQATETWPRADAKTGKLAIGPFWNEGNSLTLDNLAAYPVMKANDDIAAIDFELSDGTKLTIGGTSTSSQNTASVKNPFLHTADAARAAARMTLSAYGGNIIETTGRGDPSTEIGDVATVQLDESEATTGRVMEQTLEIHDGVLADCKTVLLQADGSFLYQNRKVMTSSGTFTAPAGVTRLRLILIGRGANGGNGTGGTFDAEGTPGADGAGGKVWAETVSINEGQSFTVTIGTNTTFGPYSSANGTSFDNGYTDIASGDSYARPGIKTPLPGTGDGGKGGAAGKQGRQHTETYYEKDSAGIDWQHQRLVVDVEPTGGKPGVAGALGCAIIFWDEPTG